ncbi:MAG: DEAD/DEAH box helicase [Candidatus Delongbacteria bacterium]|nr:DEAD/DEAH box helicase [Candidatus Delongbacteria bacterium]
MTPTSVKSAMFESFGLNEKLMQGIQAAGFKVPSPIQEKTIPLILSGVDLIAQSHTGTGKTAAFGLAAMQRMTKRGGIELLVMTPTRELANQVSDEIYRLGQFAGIRTCTVLGGHSYTSQLKMLNRGDVQVLIATPGRLLDLLKSSRIKNLNPWMVVLDEADEMLDMGFHDDIMEIFGFLPEDRQTLLFSATIPDPIRRMADRIFKNPVMIKTVPAKQPANSDIHQLYYVIEEKERQDAIIRLLEEQAPEKSIIFCRTRQEVDRLSTSLGARGFNTKPLHGEMEQPQRTEVMSGFRKSQIDVLVATDVAARGLDVSDVTHVFNYHIPFDSKSYIHRIGRTGRAGKKGTAITLVTPDELRNLERIQRDMGIPIEHRMVPTLKQLRIDRIQRLADDIREIVPNDHASSLVKLLSKDLDPLDIANRLAFQLLSMQKESGPEKIGIDQDRLIRLIAARKTNKPGKPFSNHNSNRYSKSSYSKSSHFKSGKTHHR